MGLINLISRDNSFNGFEFLLINLKKRPFRIESCSEGFYEKFLYKHISLSQFSQENLIRFFPALPFLFDRLNNNSSHSKEIFLPS